MNYEYVCIKDMFINDKIIFHKDDFVKISKVVGSKFFMPLNKWHVLKKRKDIIKNILKII